jgi:hypothetical protein
VGVVAVVVAVVVALLGEVTGLVDAFVYTHRELRLAHLFHRDEQ